MEKKETNSKRFTTAEKTAIVKEAEEKGIAPTLDKYGVYRSTFDYWRKKYLVYGPEGLSGNRQKDLSKLNQQLEKENLKLKLIIAEKELELRLKDEQLKKKYPERRK